MPTTFTASVQMPDWRGRLRVLGGVGCSFSFFSLLSFSSRTRAVGGVIRTRTRIRLLLINTTSSNSSGGGGSRSSSSGSSSNPHLVRGKGEEELTEYIVPELRKLQAHRPELDLRFRT